MQVLILLTLLLFSNLCRVIPESTAITHSHLAPDVDFADTTIQLANFDPRTYYPAHMSFANLYLPFVPSRACEDEVDDPDVKISSAQLEFTSENLPDHASPGTYSMVVVSGELVGAVPISYNFHYEIFITCPKCDPDYYINTETWNTCHSEFESIRSEEQKRGRIVPVVNGQTITLTAYLNDTDFRGCADRPEILTKRVAKNNDHQIFGCDTFTLQTALV